MTNQQKTVISLSASVLVAILLHAALTATFIRVPLPIDVPPQKSIQTFSFDTVEGSISSPTRVNAAARDEVKKQQICLPCIQSTPIVLAQAQKLPLPTIQADKAKKSYNLDIFVGDDEASKAMVRWFNEQKDLAEFRTRCNFQQYTANNALYKARYASIVPESQFPAIIFTGENGGHIYVAGRAQIPSTAAELYADISESWRLYKSVQSPPKESSSTLPTINNSLPQDCVDGTCDPETRKPFLPWRDDNASPLFPSKPFEDTNPVSFWFRQQTGIGLESAAIIALVAVVVFLLLLLRR